MKHTSVKDNLKIVKHHHIIVDRLFERNTKEAIKCVQKHVVEFYNINLDNIRNVIL